jgi:ABC-type branched-subunit amino acid transport system ATPase component
MFVIIYPESTMAQLFGYLIKIAEYPYHQYRSPSFSGKVGEKTKKLESVSKISSGIANNQQHYSFDTNILTGKAVQIVGENGAGKTFITGLMGSKGIKGYYPCEKSLHLTAECVLLPVKGAYSKVLAESFDVNELTLAHYLKDNIEKWIPKIDATLKEVYPANVSTGIKQLIHVFSALHKAVLQKYEYVCIDEALYGVSSEKGISSEVYRVIIGICDSAGIQLAIVDNGMKVDDTLQVSAASAGENETVFKV